MTSEEIEMRKVIKEMLSDVGINRETLKQMAKDVLEEKINKAIDNAMHETPGGDTLEKKLEIYACNYIYSWEFQESPKALVRAAIKVQDVKILVNVEKPKKDDE